MFDQNMFNNTEFGNLFGGDFTKDLLVGSPMWMEVFKKNLARVFDNESKMGETTEE